jgi:hypothetical protein
MLASNMAGTLGPRQSEGQRLLAQYLRDTGTTLKAFAESLGVTNPTVHAWRWAMKEPKFEYRLLIAKRTRGAIPASTWVLDEHAADPLRPTGT